MNGNSPLVSIVTATYNRSNSLYYSLSLLQNQYFKDWECIIVGDACTDDTEEVVASFKEKRFRFVNLKKNFGEQSGPNNYGCSIASGRYIAFLNHDDLWFPDHLSTMLTTMKNSYADHVYSMAATVMADDSIRVFGINSDGVYYPNIFVPASTWLFRREMLDSVGKWRSFRQTHCTPSQDWIIRGWKTKHKIIMNPELTVILVFSGWRKNSYADREIAVTRELYNAIISKSGFREKLIKESLMKSVAEETSLSFRKNSRKLFRGLVYKVLIKLGIKPLSVINFLRYGIHGGYIKYLRVKRGLEKK